MDDSPRHEPATRTAQPRIVVGVDGSEQSIIALQQADLIARALGARIEAVTTWTYPPRTNPEAEAADPTYEEAAQDTLDVALTEAYGTDRPTLLTPLVLYGNPAKVLLEHSAGAAMLIVGSRGHGGFEGLLLGSVSAQCTAHAPCPVLVAR